MEHARPGADAAENNLQNLSRAGSRPDDASDSVSRPSSPWRYFTEWVVARRRGPETFSSKTSRRVTLAVTGTMVVALSATACSGGGGQGSADASGPAYEGSTFTLATSAVPPSLNPAIGDPAYGLVYQWAYDPLLVMNGDGTYSPGLATKWGFVDKENKVYELTLREGVKFSDGSSLDAEALKKYFDYARTQKAGTTATLLAAIDSVDVVDPLRVQLKLKSPDPGLTFYFAQAFGGGDVINPSALANPASLDANTAGTGPYMLDPKQTVAGDHYVFVQNPNYWNKERQHWESVTLRVIANPSSTIQAMQAGQVQGALGDPTTLPAAKSAGLQVIAPPQALTGINLADREGKLSKPLADVRVRRALNMAVDRHAIAEALYGSSDLALSQYALKGQVPYVDDLENAYPYDPKAAKALLAEAGYPDGFKLPVLTVPLAGLDKLTQAVGGQLQEIGVTLETTSKATPSDYFTSMVSGEYPAAVIGYGLADMQTLYTGFVNPVGPFNWFKTVDPELDALYGKYRSADQESGKALQQDINRRLVDQAWTIPVVGAPLSYYLAPGLTGLDATSANAGVPLVTDVHKSKE